MCAEAAGSTAQSTCEVNLLDQYQNAYDNISKDNLPSYIMRSGQVRCYGFRAKGITYDAHIYGMMKGNTTDGTCVYLM